MEGKDETELPTYDRAIPAPSKVDSTPSGEGMEVDQDSSDSNSSKATGSHHLSPEEKDRYAYISEQLNILNSVPGSPTTKGDKPKKQGSSKGLSSKGTSPFKKIVKGVKRTHRKTPSTDAKKLRLELKDDLKKLKFERTGEVNRPLKQADFENGSSDDESSSEEERWRIFEESSGDEIDRTLENKADNMNLSALNVKSIIHKIVTDEHVLKMIQNSVESEAASDNDGDTAPEEDGSLTFEPKMTRSKVKDFIQKQGSVPHPWGLSPVKHDSPSFVDIDLPEEEEEEDEDFDPEKVPVVESDEDSESVMSSNISDLGSPAPSTPRTPCVTPSLSHRFTDTEDSQSLLSPMGPPTQLPRSAHKGMLGRKYQDAVAAEEARAKQEEEELIALRTRSKCPMTDTSILELEANFVAPDITEDMYETQCDDTDWEGFLTSLTKVDSLPNEPEDPVKGTEDAEDDDPEYNYLEEAEQYEHDTEDFRNDKAVKVSKKELHMLMDELYEAYGDMDPIDTECKTAIKAQSRQIVQASVKKPPPQPSSVWRITENERKQIDEHMRKHVQLLTQMYVLSQDPQGEHTVIAESVKLLLGLCLWTPKIKRMYDGVEAETRKSQNELYTFATRQEMAFPGRSTAYRACNLDQAHAIVNDPEVFKDTEPTETMNINKEGSKKPIFKFENSTLSPLTFPQMSLLWSSPVFLYPHLLPHGGLLKSSEIKRDRLRVKFLECEDNLLALGLEQFKNFPNGREIIQQLLLPTKTKKQISIRIKNLSARASKSNAVKFYRTNKVLPPFPRHIPDFSTSMMKAPRDQMLPAETLPSWCKVFPSPSKEKDEAETHCSNSDCVKRRSGSLSSLSAPSQGGSTPTTPLNGSTDNTLTGSSGSSGKSSTEQLTMMKRPGRRRLYNLKTTPNKKRGSFVPLKSNTFPNTSITEGRISPITVYVVDKMPTTAASSTRNHPVSMGTTLATSSVVTCVTPTIVVVNPAMAKPSTGDVTTTSTTQGSLMSKAVSMPGTTRTVDDLGDTSLQRSRSDEVQSSSKPGVHNANEENNIMNDSTMEVDPECSEVDNKQHKTNNEKYRSRSQDDLQGSGGDLELSQTAGDKLTSKGARKDVEPQLVHNTKSDSLSTGTEIQSKVMMTSELLLPSDTARAETPTNEHCVTVVQSQCTPVIIHTGPPNQGTPNSSSKSNNATPSSKSAIEIMASFAPYFISPSSLAGQEPRCQCGSERKYRPVFPKLSTAPSSCTVSPFLDKQKSKSSPRKRQLQQKARSILPKGFVISTFTSPTKKAASSLVDRAKGMKSPRGRPKGLFSPQKGTGLRKILPNTLVPSKAVVNIAQKFNSGSSKNEIVSDKNEKMETEEDLESQKDTASEYDTQESEMMSDDMLETYDNEEDDEAPGDMENVNNNNSAIVAKGGDTESEDTQSEDGNETQEESQEENVDDEDHMANLMQASTTLRYKPTKAVGGLSSLKARRHRHKDITLAMLAPDIIESDPYRDDRDTAFAQAYLLKVKKLLRDDLDNYEKFLRLMYEFNKTGQSPVKLYSDLTSLFRDYPELVQDFAGFLLPEQAVECDCFLSHQEFVRARTFLRKLEIYFSKAPSQFQKIMRVFTRWYKKPSHDLEDLRGQVETMLKGQRYLLEEFSLFFPNDKPPESAADDFEEIDFDKRDADPEFDGFEEVELPEDRDPQGTKRCQCQCHSTGDDTYRKRKKHCLSCCLTVIDGELVYRINSKTIKKINVKLGPVVKPRLADVREKTATTKPDKTHGVVEPDRSQQGGEESDTETAEKENIEHYDDSGQRAEAARVRVANKLQMVSKGKQVKPHQGGKDTHSWKKASFHHRVSSWSRKSKYSNKGAQLPAGPETKIPPDQNSNESNKSQEAANKDDSPNKELLNTENATVDHVEESGGLKVSELHEISEVSAKLDPRSTEFAGISVQSPNTEAQLSSNMQKQSVSEVGRDEGVGNAAIRDDSSDKIPVGSSSDSIMASDILARAFNSAILGEVSMDSTPIPFGSAHESPVKLGLSASQNVILQEPKPSSSSSSQSKSSGLGPEGQVNFTVSSDSSFSKIKKSGSSGFLVEGDSKHKMEEQVKASSDNEDVEYEKAKSESDLYNKNLSDSSPRDITETSVASPFSPFSPFAQEIQNITSARSPFACIKSPSMANKKQTTPKLRRITPIRVRGSNVSEDESSSAFQAVAQNSPMIEDSQTKSPFDKSNLERHSSNESLNKTPVPSTLVKDTIVSSPFDKSSLKKHSSSESLNRTTPSTLVKDITFPSNVKEFVGDLEQNASQQCKMMPRRESASESQKSLGLSGSEKSDELSRQSGSQKTEVSAESGSQKSDSGSQKSETSEQRTSPVVIGNPEMYCEDANEGFIKPFSNAADIVPTGILSENSLLGLVKGSSMSGEHLHTISNLTNILSALEKPVQNLSNSEKSSESRGPIQTQSAGAYIPQSATSIENLERLKHLDVRVSRLSDSDESCSKFSHDVSKDPEIETPCKLSHEAEADQVVTCDNTISTHQLDFSTLTDKDNESPEKTPRRYSGDQLTYLDDTTVIQSHVSEVRALTGVNVTGTDTFIIGDINRTNEEQSAETESGIDKIENVPLEKAETTQTSIDTKTTQKKSSEKTKKTARVRKSPLKSPKQTSSLGRNSARLRNSSKKPETDSQKDSVLDSARLRNRNDKSEPESQHDSVLETIEAVISESSASCIRTAAGTTRNSKSNIVTKKSIAKHTDKKRIGNKGGKFDKPTVSKPTPKKGSRSYKTAVKGNERKTKPVNKLESKSCANVTSDPPKIEIHSEESSQEATENVLLPAASRSDIGQDVRPDASGSSIEDSSIEGGEDDMVWTKDMDEVIIDGCKLHGPKDRTFSRIAKQIGGVTDKQVQKRFHRLLTLLLESGSEDEGS